MFVRDAAFFKTLFLVVTEEMTSVSSRLRRFFGSLRMAACFFIMFGRELFVMDLPTFSVYDAITILRYVP